MTTAWRPAGASTRVAAAVTTIALLAAIASSVARWGHDFSVDEPFTVAALDLPSDQRQSVLEHDNTPATYCFLALWRKLAGASEGALRAPFIAAYALAVIVTGAVAAGMGGTHAAIMASLLVACSTQVGLLHAATVRPYALLALICASATALTVRSVGPATASVWPWLLSLAGVHLAGLFTHPVYSFVAVACAFASAACGRTRRWTGAAAAGAALALYLLIWWPVLRVTFALPATAWMPVPGSLGLLDAYLGIWGNRNGFMLLGAAVTLVVMCARPARQGLIDRPLAVAAFVATLTLLLPYAASSWRPVFHPTRTPILALPALAICIAVLLSRLGRPMLSAIFAALLVIGAVQFVVATRRGGDPAPTETAVRIVVDEARCGDTLVAAGLSYAALRFYLQRVDAPECLRLESFPPEIAAHPGWIDDRTDLSVLADSARRLAAQLAGRGGRVFVFSKTRGVGQPAGDAVLGALDATLTRQQRRELRGAFFDQVSIYTGAR